MEKFVLFVAKFTGFSEVVHSIAWLNQRITRITTKVRWSVLSYLNSCCSAETGMVIMSLPECTALLS